MLKKWNIVDGYHIEKIYIIDSVTHSKIIP